MSSEVKSKVAEAEFTRADLFGEASDIYDNMDDAYINILRKYPMFNKLVYGCLNMASFQVVELKNPEPGAKPSILPVEKEASLLENLEAVIKADKIYSTQNYAIEIHYTKESEKHAFQVSRRGKFKEGKLQKPVAVVKAQADRPTIIGCAIHFKDKKKQSEGFKYFNECLVIMEHKQLRDDYHMARNGHCCIDLENKEVNDTYSRLAHHWKDHKDLLIQTDFHDVPVKHLCNHRHARIRT